MAAASLAACAPYPERHTETAPIDGRLARQVRRADALGVAPTAAFALAPVRVGDLARALGDIRFPEAPPGEEAPEPSPDLAWVSRLVEEHRAAIDEVWDESAEGATMLDPVSDARLSVVWVDEPFSFYNQEGREFHQGWNVHLSDRAVARIAKRLVVTAEPELSFVENRGSEESPGDDEDWTLRFQELTASVRLGPLEATVGRQPLWWGPGRHGSLLLSNNARPFDLVKLGTAGPQLLPGFLGWLGLVQAETFLTRLERSRAVSEPYLWGMRLSTRLNAWLEVGASRVAQFGGEGRAVDAGTIWEVITADTENNDSDPGNQLASLDARIIVPLSWQPFELYGELGGEDEAGGFFSKNAWLAGIYLPRIGPWHLFELTVEVTDLQTRNGYRVWYTNGNFPDGYTYHERVIGHHAGTDGFDVFAELRFHPHESWEAFVSFDYEEHLGKDPVSEEVYQTRVGAEARIGEHWTVSAFWGIDFWRDLRGERGEEDVGHALGIGARLSL